MKSNITTPKAPRPHWVLFVGLFAAIAVDGAAVAWWVFRNLWGTPTLTDANVCVSLLVSSQLVILIAVNGIWQARMRNSRTIGANSGSRSMEDTSLEPRAANGAGTLRKSP